MSDPVDGSRPGDEGRASSRLRSSTSPHSDGRTAVERLTDDLLVEILARLPVKSLCRFKCVSNYWLALIHHPEHRKKLPQPLAGFFYGSTTTSDSEWLLKSPVRFADFPGRCTPPITCAFLPNHRRVHLLDCCNGLLL
uniref:F-box domain-containing protein n=2 Tax=Triticum urartu TaxID=4572 RepID=A0A8R7V915_TRIUA